MPAAALVIPAWNEPETIGAVLDEVPANTVERIYVVVGEAGDPTAAAARARRADVRVVVPRRRGYGAACWAGAQAALGDGAEVVAFLDGDYSDPPAELPRVLAPLLAGQADLVLGCRDLGSSGGTALPLHARLGNRLVLLALRLLLGRPFADLPSFKAVRAEALARLDMREMTYGWTVEMLVKAARAGLCLREVEVAYRPRLAGRSKVSGSLRGTLGAAWKLCSCAVGYATWSPARP
jgi:glycosyltransferase involved in cell wall biosynthesis